MRTLLQTVNQSAQAVEAGGVISLGTTLRRIGCNCILSGNGIEIQDAGYYLVDSSISLAPTADGVVTVTALKDGVPIQGATATATGTTGDSLNLVISTTVKENCCDGNSSITFILGDTAANISNISTRIIKA